MRNVYVRNRNERSLIFKEEHVAIRAHGEERVLINLYVN